MLSAPIASMRENSLDYISGSVCHVINGSKSFKVVTLVINGKRTKVIYKGAPVKVNVGDYLCAWASAKTVDGQIEWHADSIKSISRFDKIERNSQLSSSHHYVDFVRLEKLRLRSVTEEEIKLHMARSGFLPVSSPTIVNKWPDGNTNPFHVSFYDNDVRLAISNMIYQQIMVMHGFTRIYEFGKSFRQENPSTQNRLAEYTTFDITIATEDLDVLISETEKTLLSVISRLQYESWSCFQVPSEVTFDRITYDELLSRCGLERTTGAQLNSVAKEYLRKNFGSFVWVTNFPERTRPFYTKSVNGTCDDCQLWFQGKIYIAAGSLIETDVSRYEERMKIRGQTVENFEDYLSHVRLGVPEMGQIAIGIERMIASWLDKACAAEFSWFPRFGKEVGN